MQPVGEPPPSRSGGPSPSRRARDDRRVAGPRRSRRLRRRHPGLLPLRQHRHQRGDDGQRAAHPVPRPALRAHADPVHLHGRGGPRGRGPSSTRRWTGPVTPLVFTTAAVDEVRDELPKTQCPVIDFFGLHMSGSRRSWGPRAARGPPGCTASATSSATTPDGGGRVRHRARRRPEHARPRQGRRDPGRAVAVRQDADQRCTSRCSTASSSPTTRSSTRTSRPPTCPRPVRDLRDRCFGLTTTPARLSRVRHERRPELPVRLDRAVRASSCAGPRRSTQRHRLPVIDSSAKSVEEMSTMILQTLPATAQLDPQPARPPQEPPAMSTARTTVGTTRRRQRPLVRRARPGRPRAGRRQERLARRDGPQPGRRRACRCPTASPPPPTPTGASSATPGWPSGSAASCAGLDTDDVRRARRGRPGDPRRRASSSPSRRTSRPTSATAYEQLAGETAPRTCPSPSAPARPPRTCPTPRSPGSRRPSSTSAASTRSCSAIREVFASLYNDRAIAYRVHHGFEHDDVALSAGVQRMVRSDVGASGRHVHHGHRVRVRRRRLHHLLLRPGRGASSRARSTPTSSTSTSRRCAAGRPAILKRGVGEQGAPR